MATIFFIECLGIIFKVIIEPPWNKKSVIKDFFSQRTGKQRHDVILKISFSKGPIAATFSSCLQNNCRIRFSRNSILFYNKSLKGELKIDTQPFTADFVSILDASVVYNIIELILAYVIPNRNCLLVHGSSVVWGSRSLLFPAKSESGKTTIARILSNSPFVKSVSDESTVILHKAKSKFFVQPYPLLVDKKLINDDSQYRMYCILFLTGKGRNSIVKVNHEEALRMLLKNTIILISQPELLNKILDIAVAIVSRIQCYKLSFVNDESLNRFLAKELHLPS